MTETENLANDKILDDLDPENPPDLYEILGLNSKDEITETDIRTAYRKRALRFHPDKILSSSSEEEKLQARQNFDRIGFAYKILSDPKLRQRYDKTGKADHHSFLDGLDDQASWSAYFKDLWSGEVNAKTIEEFSSKYRGSAEELKDLEEHYHNFDGSLPEILSNTMCTTEECEPRIIKRIDKLIKEGKLPHKSNWDSTKKDTKARDKRRKLAEQESKEAEELAKELGVHDRLFGNNVNNQDSTHKSTNKNKNKKDKEGNSNSEDNLKALILGNAAKKHEALIAKLEAKALSETNNNSKKSKKNNSKKRKHLANDDDEEEDLDDDQVPSTSREPTEDEFKKIQEELDGRRNQNKSKNSNKSANQSAPHLSSSSKNRTKKS